MALVNEINRILEPIRRRIALMLSKAIIDAVDDTTALQLVKLKILKNEVDTEIERPQQYGFSSVPPAGGEAVVAFIGGNRDHAVVIASDDSRHRPRSNTEGDVFVYHKDGTTFIKLSENMINIEADGRQILIDQASDKITITGMADVDIDVTGKLDVGEGTFTVEP